MIKISKNFFIRSTVFIIIICLSSCSLKSVFTQNTKLNIGIAKKDFALFQEIFKSSNFDSYQINSKILSEDEAYNSISNQDIDFYIGNIEALISEKDFLKKKIIAKDSLAWIVNSQNPISSLEVTELQEIIKGEIKNWKKINNINEPILFIGRYDENFTNQNLVNYPDLSRIESRVQAKNEEDLIANICKFKNSISYIDLSSEALQNASKSVKKIFISKNDNNSNSDSMFQREIHLYYQPELINSKLNIQSFKDFIEIFNSSEVHSYIKKNNYQLPSVSELLAQGLADEAIKIGVSVPKSGKYARFGKAVIRAVEFARDEFKASGGVLGRDIELVICNDESSIQDLGSSIDCAKQLSANNVEAVIGHLGSEASIASSSIYQANGIVQISPSAMHSGFTKQANNQGLLFRISSLDSIHAEKTIELIQKLSNDNQEYNILIIHNGSVFAENLKEQIISSARNSKIQNRIGSISSHAVESKTKTYYHLLEKENFDIILPIGPEFDVGQMMIDLAVLGKTNVDLIARGRNTDEFKKTAGLRTKHLYNIGEKFLVSENSDFQKFKAQITKTREFIPYASINSYIAARVIFEALEDYYRGNFSSLAKAIHRKTFFIWGEKIYFDELGDRLDDPLKFMKFVNGELQEIN